MEVHANTVGISSGKLKDIYIIKNDINNMMYVGQTINAKERFRSHCKKQGKQQTLVGKAIHEFGKKHFWYEILESQVPDYNEREKYWISTLNTIYPNGYNIMEGGENPPRHESVEHPFSKFETLDDVEAVKADLRNTRMSLSKIAKKHNVSKRTVLRINQGLHYAQPGETFPIRAVPRINGKLTEADVTTIIELLKNTYRQYADIAKDYGVELAAIQAINLGTMHYRDDEDYPIRKFKNSGQVLYTPEQVTRLHELLAKTSMSYRDIAKKLNVTYAFVCETNAGHHKRYRQAEYTYPIRPLRQRKKKPCIDYPREGEYANY